MRERLDSQKKEEKRFLSKETESEIQKVLDKNCVCRNKKITITSEAIKINLDEIDKTVDFMEKYLSKEITSSDLNSIIKILFLGKEAIKQKTTNGFHTKELESWDSSPFVTDFKRHINNAILDIKSFKKISSQEEQDFLFKIDKIIAKLSQISSK